MDIRQRQTFVFPLSFNAGVSTVELHCPYPVSEINVVSCIAETTGDVLGSVNQCNLFILTSDLTHQDCCGILFQKNQITDTFRQTLVYRYREARVIDGMYTFHLLGMTGTIPAYNGYMLLVLEFIGVDKAIPVSIAGIVNADTS